MTKSMEIPLAQVAPTGWEIDSPEMVQTVWDMVIAEQNNRVQSIEDRMLMAILRSYYAGLTGEWKKEESK